MPQVLLTSLRISTDMDRYRITANHPKPPVRPYLQPQASLSRRIDDAEISIFDAERYFKAGGDNNNDDPLELQQRKKTVVLGGVPESFDVPSIESYARNYQARSFRATPIASSEASWNSQTGLLANAPGSVAVSVKAYPPNGKGASSGRRFLGIRCPCYGKKSVQVKEKFSPRRSQYSNATTKQDVVQVRSSTGTIPNYDITEITKVKIQAKDPGFISAFSFPVLPQVKMPEEPPRESLEVFRPPGELARVLKKPELIQRVAPDDDMASDASSDLFELESFSAVSSAYRRRDLLDELPKLRRSLEESVAASECYAPSEASVEWSVMTAEGGFDRASAANFSSAASDCGDKDRFQPAAAGPVKKRGGGGLLSCRCEKAVSVGPDPVRFVPDQPPSIAAGPAALPARITRLG